MSTRRLASEFARDGWNVLWITLPLMPWHRLTKRQAYYQELAAQQNSVFYANNIFAYTPTTWMPFSRHFPLDRPFLAQAMWQGCWPSIRRVLDRANIPEPEVLWLAHWAAGGVMDLFPDRPTIFHVTDHYNHFPSTPNTCLQIEQENYRRADRIVVTAPSLSIFMKTQFSAVGDKVSIITHGVDTEPYSQSMPDPLRNFPHPRIVALGNTQWLDYEILDILATTFSQGIVIILGPITAETKHLTTLHSNIFAPGGINPEEVPAYLKACDVGLILFGNHVRQVAEDVCPMKLFEYAAAGLPIVSTPLPIYRHFQPLPIFEVSSPSSAVEAVLQALAQKDSIAEQMRAFAHQHTWQKKYSEAVGIIDTYTSRH